MFCHRSHSALGEVAKPEVIEAAVGQDLAHMSRYANRSMSTHDMCQKLIANKMGEVCKDVIAPCEEIVLSMVTELLHQVFVSRAPPVLHTFDGAAIASLPCVSPT